MTATPPTDPPTPPPDPLFGSSSRYRAGWSRHDWVLGKTGFATIAKQLPHLAALSLRLSWIADRRATAVVMACQLATGAFTAFGFLAVNGVFHKLIASGATPAGLHAAVPPALAAAAAAGLNRAADAVARGTATRLKPKVERMAKEELYRCTNETELLAFQQSGLKDIVDSAQFGATWTQYVIDRLVGMVASVMSLVAVAGVLAVLHPVLLALLPLIVLPGAVAAVRTTQRMYRSRLSQLTLSRQHRDISMLMTDASTAEEIRVHDAGAFLLAHFSRLAAKLEAEQARLGRVETRSSLLAGAGTGLTLAVTYTALFLLLDSGAIRQAAAYTAALALRTGTSQLTTLVTRVTGLFEFGLYIADWEQACLEARRQAMPSGGVPVPEPPKRIEALDVRFKYPNSTRLALDGVSLTIEAGQTVALVGHNGSGKTTLAKLLTGLYLPESGAVAWDGVPTTGLDRRQAFGHVALLSQGFFCWPFTVRANIGIGRPDRVADAAALAAAISAAGAEFIHSLPQQADTLLTADYDDGVKPSGGEWQQVGLARAYFRDAPIIVMDEPTAALDPKAEAEVFERVRAGAGSRTVILITHRLASVRHAHQIVVLDHGRVVEVGGHAELLAAGGLYAGLYALQAGQYGIGVVDGDAPPAVSPPA